MEGNYIRATLFIFLLGWLTCATASYEHNGDAPYRNQYDSAYDTYEQNTDDTTYELAHECEVNLPTSSGTFGITIEKQWFNPNMSNLTYGRRERTDPDRTFVKFRILDEDGAIGVRAAVNFVFPGRGKDFVVAAEFHEWDHTESFFGDNNLVTGGLIFDPTTHFTLMLEGDFARAKLEIEHDIYDIEFGQNIDIGDHVALRVFEGLRFTNFDMTFSNRVTVVDLGGAGTSIFFFKNSTNFDGLGPRIGFDGLWRLGEGYGIRGRFSTALLVGDVENHLDFTNDDVLNPPEVSGRQEREFRECIVANFNGRLAFEYRHTFYYHSELIFDIGYQNSKYFDMDNRFSILSGDFNCGCDVGEHGVFISVNYTL